MEYNVPETPIQLQPASMELAHRTLLNSTLDAGSTLVGTGVEDVEGVPMVYFDFRSSAGKTRLYAD